MCTDLSLELRETMVALESWVKHELLCGDDLGVSLSILDERVEAARRRGLPMDDAQIAQRVQILRLQVQAKCRADPRFDCIWKPEAVDLRADVMPHV